MSFWCWGMVGGCCGPDENGVTMAATSIVEIGGGGDAAAVAATIGEILGARTQFVNGLWKLVGPSGDQLNVSDNLPQDQHDGYQVDVFAWRAGHMSATKYEVSDRAGRELFDLLAARTTWQLRLWNCTDELLATRAAVAAPAGS